MNVQVDNIWDTDVVSVVTAFTALREAIGRTDTISDAGLEVLARRAMEASDKYPTPDNDCTSAQGIMNDLLVTYAHFCRAVVTERREAHNSAAW